MYPGYVEVLLMCLGVPAKVVDVHSSNSVKLAKVVMGGIVSEVLVVFNEELKPGDYVIVHAGMAISKISEDEVKEITELLKELEDVFTTQNS